MINSEDLHRAADEVHKNIGTPDMDALAEAGAVFLAESNLTVEDGTPVELDRKSIGYGIMIGYIAARQDCGDPL